MRVQRMRLRHHASSHAHLSPHGCCCHARHVPQRAGHVAKAGNAVHHMVSDVLKRVVVRMPDGLRHHDPRHAQHALHRVVQQERIVHVAYTRLTRFLAVTWERTPRHGCKAEKDVGGDVQADAAVLQVINSFCEGILMLLLRLWVNPYSHAQRPKAALVHKGRGCAQKGGCVIPSPWYAHLLHRPTPSFLAGCSLLRFQALY
mmetsp:Transcript_21429/g.59360  ORF Transcript_21429/g.59360 Transcript_21429/m.59360 type:complete len:202 (+) Transcript_21429:671-1276(+)